MNQLYYVENKERGCVGNSVMWWAFNDNGYTCDIRSARRFLAEELTGIDLVHKYRVHKVDDVDRLIQCHIDIQDLMAQRKKPHTRSYLDKNS